MVRSYYTPSYLQLSVVSCQYMTSPQQLLRDKHSVVRTHWQQYRQALPLCTQEHFQTLLVWTIAVNTQPGTVSEHVASYSQQCDVSSFCNWSWSTEGSGCKRSTQRCCLCFLSEPCGVAGEELPRRRQHVNGLLSQHMFDASGHDGVQFRVLPEVLLVRYTHGDLRIVVTHTSGGTPYRSIHAGEEGKCSSRVKRGSVVVILSEIWLPVCVSYASSLILGVSPLSKRSSHLNTRLVQCQCCTEPPVDLLDAGDVGVM
jgi:hypothetical protein